MSLFCNKSQHKHTRLFVCVCVCVCTATNCLTILFFRHNHKRKNACPCEGGFQRWSLHAATLWMFWKVLAAMTVVTGVTVMNSWRCVEWRAVRVTMSHRTMSSRFRPGSLWLVARVCLVVYNVSCSACSLVSGPICCLRSLSLQTVDPAPTCNLTWIYRWLFLLHNKLCNMYYDV